MAHDDKLRAPRNILLEPDLELEMSGIDERGIKPPPTRLPGKTHLAGVLLTANPWEKRDLDRKLLALSRLRVHRERAHVWAQRRFFISSIFDANLALRFGKLDVGRELAASRRRDDRRRVGLQTGSLSGDAAGRAAREPEVGENGGDEEGKDVNLPPEVVGNGDRPHLHPSRTDLSDNINKGGGGGGAMSVRLRPLRRDKSRRSVGIFATPLAENRRRKPKKIRSTTACALSRPAGGAVDGDQGGGGGDDNDDDDDAEADAVSMMSPTQLKPALIEKAQTAPQILLHRPTAASDHNPDLNHDLEGSAAALSPPSKHRPKHDVSFKLEDEVIEEGVGSDTKIPPGAPEEDRISGRSRQQEAVGKAVIGSDSDSDSGDICDEAVIAKLTRTLPTALMLKANASINAVINDRKAVLMTSSRRISSRDTLLDERWQRLESALSRP